MHLRCRPPFPQCLLDGCQIIGLGRLCHEPGHLLGEQPPVALGHHIHPSQFPLDIAVCVADAVVNGGRAFATAYRGSTVRLLVADLGDSGDSPSSYHVSFYS